MTEADSPGKLVITGEYAVLDGAPAVSMAIDVRARAVIDNTGAAVPVFRVRSTGEEYSFGIDNDRRFAWIGSDPGQRGKIVAAVFSTLQTHYRCLDNARAFRVTLDTDGFFHSSAGEQVKLGLGSSAAVLVALTAALDEWFGLSCERPEFTLMCRAAHRKFQRGAGSGVDIATSIHGGVVAMCQQASGPATGALSWPEGLQVLAVWSGESASTTDRLARYAAFRSGDSRAFEKQLAGLTTCAEDSLAAWRTGSADDVLRSARDYDHAMLELDRTGEIGIETDTHRHLREIVRAHGAVYKISGAGGGDFGLAMAAGADVIADVAADFARQGFFTLPGTPAVEGVRVKRD